jgi:hypothetical protein
MFFNDKKRKFIFRCEKCEAILQTEFEEEKDIEDVNEDKFLLECMCGGYCFVLRD